MHHILRDRPLGGVLMVSPFLLQAVFWIAYNRCRGVSTLLPGFRDIGIQTGEVIRRTACGCELVRLLIRGMGFLFHASRYGTILNFRPRVRNSRWIRACKSAKSETVSARRFSIYILFIAAVASRQVTLGKRIFFRVFIYSFQPAIH